MKKLMTTAVLGVALATPLAAEELKVFNWAEYIGPETIANFEAETGIDVTYDTYDSIETLETRILAGGSGFDVVFAAGPTAQRFIGAGLIAPLDKAALANHGNLNPAVIERIQGFDPGAEHLAPYMWGTIGLGFNPAKVEEVLPGADMSDLAMIFDPANAEKLAQCGLAMIDSPNEVLGLILNYLGEDPQTADKAVMKKAEDVLTAIRPHIRYFDSIKPIDDLATGETCVSLIYSGDAGIASYAASEADNGVEVFYSIPKQGSLVWVDSMITLADAENKDAAAKFIDYMLRPEVAAEATNFLYYANANAAANDLVDAEITGDPNIYPTPEVMERLYPEVALGNKAQRLRTRTWTRIKTGQ
ncbi:extracellular solute-binding protein [Rhodobacteraceae bacterium B1Z28]|uniref:Putrescine-binding periplasmic protein n=1 Tax=Ruegeria haliotis TaxID=2747601 RepID=A0ABX2PTB6_9RHOB|nr:extracellular solute-binding protein [Ruegeria haliotis]NVO57413.1 extracellular solute-binding protein [Ruegeria haliotis]